MTASHSREQCPQTCVASLVGTATGDRPPWCGSSSSSDELYPASSCPPVAHCAAWWRCEINGVLRRRPSVGPEPPEVSLAQPGAAASGSPRAT